MKKCYDIVGGSDLIRAVDNGGGGSLGSFIGVVGILCKGTIDSNSYLGDKCFGVFGKIDFYFSKVDFEANWRVSGEFLIMV